jgi:hypothetical protein
MRPSFALIVLLCLSACATATIEKGVPYFIGKDISFAIEYLGYPDEEMNLAGKKVYVWKNSFSHTSSMTVFKPQYTTASTPFGPVSSFTSVQDEVPISIDGDCRIRLITTNKKVVGAEFEGNEAGCAKYSDRLQRLVDDMKPNPKDTKQ